MDKPKPIYIMVPRKFVIAWVTSSIVLFILGLSCIQWTNYVNKRSNLRWCSILSLSVENYKKIPKPTDLQTQGFEELQRLRNDFNCK